METSGPKEGFSLSDVAFAEATPAQRILAWKLNGASWASPMTVDEYVGREETLSQTALSRDDGTKYWVLHLKSDPDEVISGCETTLKKLHVADAEGSRLVDAYSIASVFTDPRYRGFGLASFMLRELQTVVDQTTEAGALYSDIGRVFYTKLGWRDCRSPQVALKIREDFQPAESKEIIVKLFDDEHVMHLCDRDVMAVTRRFQHLADHNDGRTHVTFAPTYEQMSWHFTRDAYVCRVVLKREVQHRGAVTADEASWIYWDHDVREKKLKILRVVTDDLDPLEKRISDVKALLQAALKEAKDWDIPTVLVWDPDQTIGAAVTDIWREYQGKLALTFDERESGSIPALRWKGGREVNNMVWEYNEYFSWC